MKLPKPRKSVPTSQTGDKKPREKEAKSAVSGKHLTIIKSPEERADAHESTEEGKDTGAVAGEGSSRYFRQIVSRASSKASAEMYHHPRLARAPRAKGVRKFRLFRFYLRLGCRRIRRFHARFTFGQILGFYIGLPAGISAVLCLTFLMAKPPRGVIPERVPRQKPPMGELLRQIQSALEARDTRAAQAIEAGLEEFYADNPRTFVARGTIFAREKNYEKARQSYLHALELSPDLPSALINLGEIEFAAGNYGKAVGYYERAGKRVPRNALILFRCYLCYSMLGESSKAENMEKELAGQPHSVEWYFIQASEALHAGNLPEARRLIATAETLFGDRAAAYQESFKKIGWLK